MEKNHRERSIQRSWEVNAAAWTIAVRQGLIESRRAGTDAAILAACRRLHPRRVLDIGCGEGWLVRALEATAEEIVGIDKSSALIEEARAAGAGHYEILDYETLINDSTRMPGPWDAIVCNFALLSDPIAPLMTALGQRLSPAGRLLIQTVHPWSAAGEEPYEDSWREESFSDFGIEFPAPMPWFFRTLNSWFHEIRQAGLAVEAIEEPMNAATAMPLSLLCECSSELNRSGS